MRLRKGWLGYLWVKLVKSFNEKLINKKQDDVEIVNYQDEPDYSKEYPEYEPELNSEMSNDFIAEVVAEEVEEPEEVEEADVQRSGMVFNSVTL